MIGRILCAIFGHSWDDEDSLGPAFMTCNRCQERRPNLTHMKRMLDQAGVQLDALRRGRRT